jgi:cytoskeletal protein RodZ
MVVAVAALAGAAIGWRFPFLGDNRAANQLNNSGDATKTQPASSTKLATKQPASNLKSTQPATTTAQAPNTTTTAQAPNTTTTTQAPNTTTTTQAPSNQPATQSPDATVNPEATQTAPSAATDANQPVPALW